MNYAYFLITLKNLLPGKSVSIAAPAGYWYLRAFPIGLMSNFLDYIVYMTYDLHGQVRRPRRRPPRHMEEALVLIDDDSGTQATNGRNPAAQAGTASAAT